MNRQLHHHEHREGGAKYPLSIMAVDIVRTGNVGSLFRIADALGAEHLYLCGTTPCPPNEKIRKSSRSTEKYVPFTYEKDPMALVNRLKTRGYTIISLELTTTSQDVKRYPVQSDQKICLILGAEDSGVPQILLDASDACVHIPMRGINSSMNVADACAIAAYVLIDRAYLYPS